MTRFKPGDRVVYHPALTGSVGVHGLTGTVHEQTGALKQRAEFAQYVAEALNARVFGEE